MKTGHRTLGSYLPGDLSRSPILYHPRREPTQSGVMTRQKIIDLINAGYGQGHREHYKPWLRVEKRDNSPVSAIGRLPSPELGHKHHYRSKDERKALLVLKWCEPYDIRDQYPIWPWSHSHPGYGLPGFDDYPDALGLHSLAAASGLSLRSSPLRVIHTLDMLTTWRGKDGKLHLVAQDCKPEELREGPDAWNALERMEAARRYCAAVAIPYQIISSITDFGELTVNLDALRPQLPPAARDRIRASSAYKWLVDACFEVAYREPLQMALDRAALKTRLPMDLISRMLALALWHQDVDHDLRFSREPWLPLRRGGLALKVRLTHEFSAGLA